MTSPNPFAPPTSRVADVQSLEENPHLWNPRIAANWSLLFSPVFGAFVQMKNWEALGEPARAQKSRNWAIGSLAFFFALTLFSGLMPESKVIDRLGSILTLVLLVVWYYADGKSQQVYVLGKFGKTYRKKGWGKPLLIGVAGVIGFVLIMAMFGFVLGMLTD